MPEIALAELPGLSDLPAAQVRIIRAMRLAVMLNQLRRDPRPELGKHFGSPAAGCAFMTLMRRCGENWPDPVVVQPPCCRNTSFDEILITDMIAASVKRDRREFDRLVCEMIGQEGRDGLYPVFTDFVQHFMGVR